MRKKTVQTSSTKGNAKSNTKSNARNSVKSSVKSSAKNSPQKAVKTVAPTVENVSVKQAVIIQEPSVEQNEQNIPTRQPDLGPRRSVAFIGSECYPFVKTGGLGDVMSALPKSLAKLNIDVKVIIPRYKCIPQKFQEKMEYRGSFDMNLCSDGKQYYVGIMEYQEDGVVYDFIDNDEFFSWGNPYTNLIDDIPKFCYFAKAALAALNYLNWTPDVVHCHDWQAALVPLYLRTCFQDTDVGRAISVLTIHNLKFQGIYDRKMIQYWSGLPDYVFNKDCMIQNWLDANMLKGGIAYSNKVTTVSNTYAWEIQTEEYGEGLAEKIATAGSLQVRSQLFLQTYLQQFPELTDTRHNLERYVRRRIYETKGTIGIQNLAEETGYSACYLRRVFEQIHGISPKLFERFIRFQNMLYLMEQQEWQSQKMDALCFESGYYDQSHMMKDFKRFAGRTPEQYRKFRLQPEE